MAKVMTPSKPMSSRQLDKLVSHYRAMLEKHRNELGSSGAVQQVLSGGKYLDEQLAVLRRHVESVSVLTYRGSKTIRITAERPPLDFYQDRDGLWVWGDFQNRVATRAGTIEVDTVINVDYHEITIPAENGATDEQIETALGSKHLFDETTVSALIAEMISAQEGGRAGLLLNDGKVNLFYISGRVVLVSWLAGSSRWVVDTWGRDDDRWNRGPRVFRSSN